MKLTTNLALIGALVLLPPAGGQAPDKAEVAFQAALKKETVDGDLKAAIDAYRKVAAEHRGNRAVAARALVQIGQCYEKLGDAEARKAYGQVVREFSDQAELAATARTRLAALARPARPSGVSLRRVFEDMPARARPVAVSSDNRYFLYLGPPAAGGFNLVEIATSQKRQLGRRMEGDGSLRHDALFSPDSRQVAYVREGKGGFLLRVEPLYGNGSRTVFRSEHQFELKGWFPDAQRLLILTWPLGGTRNLYAVSLADGSSTLVKQGDGEKLNGAWLSPDGKYVAYTWLTNRDPQHRSISVLSLEDNRETLVVDHPSQNALPRWTPDSRGLLFLSDRRGAADLWLLPLRGGRPAGAPTVVKQDLRGMNWPLGLTRDGTFYFESSYQLQDTYLGEYDPATGKWVALPSKLSPGSTGETSAPAFTDDGRWLAYSRKMQGAQAPLRALVLRSLADGREREVPTEFDWVEWQVWFPDGKSLLVQGTTAQPGSYGVYRFDTETRRLIRLRQNRWSDWVDLPAIARDGKTAFVSIGYSSSRDSTMSAWNIETGEMRDLVTASRRILSPRISPDGRKIAFTRVEDDTSIIEIAGLDGANRREIYRFRSPEDRLGNPIWTPDGNQLLFAQPPWAGNRLASLHRIAVEGGAAQRVGLTAEGTAVQGMTLGWFFFHPGGRYIAFDAGDNRRECWALENFLPGQRAAR